MTKEKKQYEAPSLATVEFKMERGYAFSSPLREIMFRESSSTDQVESYETGNGWNEGSNSFWD